MTKLATLYNEHHGKVSDKWTSYLEAYDDLFSAFVDRPVRILEIGIQNGGSLELWSKFFPKAEVIVGCDINPLCSELTYEDPRVKVIVGDANEKSTFDRVTALSDSFDIIIDDGSHVSGDIIRSFALYFPVLAEGGVFVAEDLHCSYWSDYEGGMEAPFSSISFFKRLADYVNRDHWGGSIDLVNGLSFFSDFYQIKFEPNSLKKITEVRFRNSLAAVFAGLESKSLVGVRIVVGKDAKVEKAVVGISGTSIRNNDESTNVFGPLGERSEASVYARTDIDQRNLTYQKELSKMQALEAALQRTENALVRARKTPLEPLAQRLGFLLLSAAQRVWPSSHGAGQAWIVRKLEKLDPKRGYRKCV